MHAITIVQDVLRIGWPHIHAARLKSLSLVIRAALDVNPETSQLA
jgi:hypothetical protein